MLHNLSPIVSYSKIAISAKKIISFLILFLILLFMGKVAWLHILPPRTCFSSWFVAISLCTILAYFSLLSPDLKIKHFHPFPLSGFPLYIVYFVIVSSSFPDISTLMFFFSLSSSFVYLSIFSIIIFFFYLYFLFVYLFIYLFRYFQSLLELCAGINEHKSTRIKLPSVWIATLHALQVWLSHALPSLIIAFHITLLCEWCLPNGFQLKINYWNISFCCRFVEEFACVWKSLLVIPFLLFPFVSSFYERVNVTV